MFKLNRSPSEALYAIIVNYRVVFLTGPTQKSSKYGTGPPQQEKLTKYTGPTQDLLTQTSSKYGTGTPHLAPPFKSQTINAIFPYLTHIVALPSPVVNVIVKCHCIINDVVTNQDMVLPQQFNISSSPHCPFSLLGGTSSIPRTFLGQDSGGLGWDQCTWSFFPVGGDQFHT